eukprot:1195972-Prorocentrum_minimum.AAC.8
MSSPRSAPKPDKVSQSTRSITCFLLGRGPRVCDEELASQLCRPGIPWTSTQYRLGRNNSRQTLNPLTVNS